MPARVAGKQDEGARNVVRIKRPAERRDARDATGRKADESGWWPLRCCQSMLVIQTVKPWGENHHPEGGLQVRSGRELHLGQRGGPFGLRRAWSSCKGRKIVRCGRRGFPPSCFLLGSRPHDRFLPRQLYQDPPAGSRQHRAPVWNRQMNASLRGLARPG